MLPVIITAGTLAQLALAAGRRGEGRLHISAVLDVSIPVDGVGDLDPKVSQKV